MQNMFYLFENQKLFLTVRCLSEEIFLFLAHLLRYYGIQMLKSFELMDYEKEWLLALLFIPNFNFKVLENYNEIDAIVSITKSIQHFHNAIELSSLLTQNETEE